MVKEPCSDRNGEKKGAWSEDEDNKLRAYIQRYGHWNWRLLPKFAGLSRSGKSCRLRWVNYLRPNVKHGNFTKEEDDIIVDLHIKLGNKWSAMAAMLPGRSDNEIKNRWNTHLKKQVQKNQHLLEIEYVGIQEPDQANHKEDPIEKSGLKLQQEVEILSAGVSSQSPSSSSSIGPSSCWLSGSDCAVSNDVRTPEISDYQMAGDFWTEPFLPDNDGIVLSGDNFLSPLNLVNDFISQSSCQGMMMTDEFLWSTLDLYVEYNSQFIS